MAHGPEGHDRLGDAREQGLRGRRDALALRASLRSDRRGVPSREPRPRARRIRRRKREGSAGGAGHAPADPVRAALGSGALARPALRLDRGPVAPFRSDRPRPLSVLLGRLGNGALGRSRRDDRPLRGGRDRGRAVPPWRHPVHRHRAAAPAGRRARRREASRAGAGPRRDPRDRRVPPGEPRSRGGDRLMGALIQYFVDHPLAIPLFLLMFTAIIAVHEFGHYLTARLLGMRVLEFAFGFPPRIAAIRRGGIDYSINAIPFGGFVRILGQDDFSIEQHGAGDPGSFTSKSWWAQAIVLAAGVAMNFVLAVVVLTAAFAIGTEAPAGVVQVEEVASGSPAAAAGIQPGDLIRSIDGKEITRTSDLQTYVYGHAGKEVSIVIERGGSTVGPLILVPRPTPPENEGPLGVKLTEATTPPTALPLPQAFAQAVRLTGDVVVQIADLPAQLLNRPAGQPGPPPVGGPIQIFLVTAAVSQLGPAAFLKLIGVISVNLGVLNIIPFPGLAGERLFFVLLPAVLRRRLSPQVEAAIHAVGFVLLLGLLVVVSVADIRRAAGG